MTERLPEPTTQVGPAAGGNLRASDADRAQVATVLNTAYAEGRLTRDEHDQRLDEVMAARTFDDLIPITRDLVVVAPPPPACPDRTSTSFAVDSTAADQQVDTLIAIFGGVNRTGPWRIRKKTKALALFGGIDLDLNQAVFEDPVVEITGVWCFGGLDIKVPAGMEVRDRTAGIFGGSDVRDLGEHQPGAPVLIIKGLALFGGVMVRGPKPAKQSRK